MGKRCCLIFAVVAAAVIMAVCIGIPLASQKGKQTMQDEQESSIDTLCYVTLFPGTCKQTLRGANFTADAVTKLSLQSAQAGVDRTRDQLHLSLHGTAPDVVYAVDVCSETLELSQEHIAAALTELRSVNETSRSREEAMSNVKAWMSAAMEFHTTCVDAVLDVGNADRFLQAKHTDHLFSNALALVNAMDRYGDDLTSWKNEAFSFLQGDQDEPAIPGFSNRRLLWSDWTTTRSDFLPAWIDADTEKHLLRGNWYDVKVAKDGSGDFDLIQAAVDMHAVNTARLVIYVKAGVYDEQVNVSKTCKFLTIVGDGDATIITGHRSVAFMPGMKTFNSATLIVEGEGFLGKSFMVENTAGAAGEQAVAYRGSADMIAFYQVTFDSYQDTLYAHAGRHFYRECTIRGTVDFIFGNAAAAFQSCTVVAKRTTLLGQQNTYSAQGRTDPHQSTGLVFQNCIFDGTPELKADTSNYKTFLGRPWKEYAVCVVMKSELVSQVDPTGWLPWNASSFGLYTSFFAEYQNFGAASSPASRVRWSHQISHVGLANQYTANSFVHAGYWTRGYNIPLTTAL